MFSKQCNFVAVCENCPPFLRCRVLRAVNAPSTCKYLTCKMRCNASQQPVSSSPDVFSVFSHSDLPCSVFWVNYLFSANALPSPASYDYDEFCPLYVLFLRDLSLLSLHFSSFVAIIPYFLSIACGQFLFAIFSFSPLSHFPIFYTLFRVLCSVYLISFCYAVFFRFSLSAFHPPLFFEYREILTPLPPPFSSFLGAVYLPNRKCSVLLYQHSPVTRLSP